jgi:GNAT superfamily N-acetyltransferase
MELTIRPMTANDDIEQITDWFEAIGTEWLMDYESGPRKREEPRQRLLDWMRGSGVGSCVLLAETRTPRIVVGFAIPLLQTDPNTDRKYGTINGIYVEPGKRGEGVGRALKEAADEWCRNAGAAYMKAYIGIGNRQMLRICKLLGYEPWMITWVRRFD